MLTGMIKMRGAGVRWLVGFGVAALLVSGCSSDSGASAKDKQGPPSTDVSELVLTGGDLPAGYKVKVEAESAEDAEGLLAEQDKTSQDVVQEWEDKLRKTGGVTPTECVSMIKQSELLVLRLIEELSGGGEAASGMISDNPTAPIMLEVISTKPLADLTGELRNAVATCGKINFTALDGEDGIPTEMQLQELNLPSDLRNVDAFAYRAASTIPDPYKKYKGGEGGGDVTVREYAGYAQVRDRVVYVMSIGKTGLVVGEDEFLETFTAAVRKVRDAE